MNLDPSHSDVLDHINNGSAIDLLDMPVACGLCGRTLPSDDEVNSSLQTVSICGDCKFLLLEDFGTPSHDSHRRRLSRRRRSMYGSSESIEDLFSHHFSQMINLARHVDSEHEDLTGNVDPNLSSLQPASSRTTTPNGSRRWRRVISDTESDGFNSDSIYGESESNVSFGAYRVSHGDSDAVSFSTDIGGDSDVSVDGRATLFDTDLFVQTMERSDIDSDTDIDPMHAGVVQWNSDGHDEEVEDVVIDWAEVDADISGGSELLIRHRGRDRSEYEGITTHWRIREVGEESSGNAPYLGNPGDYLDARGFEEFLDHLAETDSSRRGAPPASASYVSSLPLVVISEEHQKADDGLACAICKDFLRMGAQVKQLPCLHLYHPCCILPWLNARNSCPLCRYELPTDDLDYEQAKRRNANNLNARRMVIAEIQQQDGRDDNDSDESVIEDEVGEVEVVGDVGPRTNTNNGGTGRWLFLAAAPIVSLMGIVFVLWLGNPSATGGGRGGTCLNINNGQPNLLQGQLPHSGTSLRNHRARRWWWF